jgi:hypothetical protein
MRLWSIHPSYLDARGLVAVWREALLAQKVLQGKTEGYKHHPQLVRFNTCRDPFSAIGFYLKNVYEESLIRGYSFNKKKIESHTGNIKIPVTDQQLFYEFNHLKKKLKSRSPSQFKQLKSITIPEAHPLFTIVSGEVEKWEKVKE